MEIQFSGLCGGAISALAVDQGGLGGLKTRIRAGKGSGLAQISSFQGVAPLEGWRRLSLEINFSGLRCVAISVLAVDQVYLGGPETRRKKSADAEIHFIFHNEAALQLQGPQLYSASFS